MNTTLITSFGIFFIFFCTTLGAGVVYFFKKQISPKFSTLILGFAAGTMIFVVAEELIPETKLEDHPHFGIWGVMLGFALMMILDVVMA